jgi:hypothetical protein
MLVSGLSESRVSLNMRDMDVMSGKHAYVVSVSPELMPLDQLPCQNVCRLTVNEKQLISTARSPGDGSHILPVGPGA